MHGFSPFFAPTIPGPFIALLPLLALAAVWELVLKGFGLWYAARGNQKWWFIAILIFNTLGILPIVYLIWFRPAESKSAAPGSSAPESTGGPSEA